MNAAHESSVTKADRRRAERVAPASAAARSRVLRSARYVLPVAAAAAVYGRLLSTERQDFAVFWDVGRAALARGDIYAPGATTGMYVFYPPQFSLFMLPFGLLPRLAAACAWLALKLAAMVFLVHAVDGLLEDAAPGLRGWRRAAAVALPFVVLVNPFNGELKLGQMNVFVLAATVATMIAVERGHSWRAALAFSIALVKATPWVFIPWFILRRQWSFLARLACVGAAWLAALAAWYGPGRVVPLVQQWRHVSRALRMGLDSMAYFENQALLGAAARLAVSFPALQRTVLGVAAYELVWMAGGAALFGVLFAIVWRDRFRPTLPATEFAYMCVVMLLFSPETRWAHQVQLLVPVAVITAIALRTGGIPWLDGTTGAPGSSAAGLGERGNAAAARLRPIAQGVLATGLVVLVVLTRDIVGKPLDNALRDARLHFAYLVVLAAALAAVLSRPGWRALSVERVTAPRSAR